MAGSFTPYKEFEPLPNVAEITEKELAESKLFVYKPDQTFSAALEVKAKDHHTMVRDGKYYRLILAFAMFDGTGYAIEPSKGKLRYYKFARCYHTKKTQRNIGNCLNEYTCIDCGFKEVIDSSD